VLIAQVSASFHGERAAVTGTEPAGNRRDVNAEFDAASRAQMPQVVVDETGNSQFLVGRVNRLLAFAHARNRIIQSLRLP
jgi:hypothetical protein